MLPASPRLRPPPPPASLHHRRPLFATIFASPSRISAIPPTPLCAPSPPLRATFLHRSTSGVALRLRLPLPLSASSVFLVAGSRGKVKKPSFLSSRRGYVVCAQNDTNSEANLKVTDQKISDIDGVEPFRGKSGSVSFVGLTHQLVEERKLVSAPLEASRSLLWIFAPVALILSVMLPQFVGILTDGLFKDMVLSEIVASVTSEVMFYVGLATFLLVTDCIQRPYLEFSSKRWGLITGLRGYLNSAFFVMGFKVCAPLFAVFVTWPLLGVSALVSVGPYLVGCLVQFIFEKILEKRHMSCWPLVPIIFEVYRLYQLSKAMHFMEKLMFQMRGLPKSPEIMERSGALAAMIVTFEVLAVLCIWSFLTFLQRLFPSRPVAENY